MMEGEWVDEKNSWVNQEWLQGLDLEKNPPFSIKIMWKYVQ